MTDEGMPISKIIAKFNDKSIATLEKLQLWLGLSIDYPRLQLAAPEVIMLSNWYNDALENHCDEVIQFLCTLEPGNYFLNIKGGAVSGQYKIMSQLIEGVMLQEYDRNNYQLRDFLNKSVAKTALDLQQINVPLSFSANATNLQSFNLILNQMSVANIISFDNVKQLSAIDFLPLHFLQFVNHPETLDYLISNPLKINTTYKSLLSNKNLNRKQRCELYEKVKIIDTLETRLSWMTTFIEKQINLPKEIVEDVINDIGKEIRLTSSPKALKQFDAIISDLIMSKNTAGEQILLLNTQLNKCPLAKFLNPLNNMKESKSEYLASEYMIPKIIECDTYQQYLRKNNIQFINIGPQSTKNHIKVIKKMLNESAKIDNNKVAL